MNQYDAKGYDDLVQIANAKWLLFIMVLNQKKSPSVEEINAMPELAEFKRAREREEEYYQNWQGEQAAEEATR